jgi:GT2 family glycosyltransferase
VESKVCVCLVLYGCGLRNTRSFAVLRRAAEKRGGAVRLFVQDNSPLAALDAGFIEGFGGFSFVHDPANPGVSRAYNRALDYAEKSGSEWLLLLDQDTELPEDYFDVLEDWLRKHPD